MDTSRHAGRTAIVTGAGSGIGRATALRLAGEGARVIACDVVEAGLDPLEKELVSLDADFVTVQADVTDQADVERVVANAEGTIDVLANVAGSWITSFP